MALTSVSVAVASESPALVTRTRSVVDSPSRGSAGSGSRSSTSRSGVIAGETTTSAPSEGVVARPLSVAAKSPWCVSVSLTKGARLSKSTSTRSLTVSEGGTRTVTVAVSR